MVSGGRGLSPLGYLSASRTSGTTAMTPMIHTPWTIPGRTVGIEAQRLEPEVAICSFHLFHNFLPLGGDLLLHRFSATEAGPFHA